MVAVLGRVVLVLQVGSGIPTTNRVGVGVAKLRLPVMAVTTLRAWATFSAGFKPAIPVFAIFMTRRCCAMAPGPGLLLSLAGVPVPGPGPIAGCRLVASRRWQVDVRLHQRGFPGVVVLK